MGNMPSRKPLFLNFEDMQRVIKTPEMYLLIHTFPKEEQNCLIYGSIAAEKEESHINDFLQKNRNKDLPHIVIYGKHANDESTMKKYHQLASFGFSHVYVYPGGLFEWLLLQDIYGFDEFPTTTKQLDLLRYKPSSKLNTPLFIQDK